MPFQDVTKKQFGQRLRELRVAAGMTQSALAEQVGVSQGRLSQWEDGDAEPLITTAVELAYALGVTEDELFKHATSRPPKPRKGRPPKQHDSDEDE